MRPPGLGQRRWESAPRPGRGIGRVWRRIAAADRISCLPAPRIGERRDDVVTAAASGRDGTAGGRGRSGEPAAPTLHLPLARPALLAGPACGGGGCSRSWKPSSTALNRPARNRRALKRPAASLPAPVLLPPTAPAVQTPPTLPGPTAPPTPPTVVVPPP